MMTVRFSSGQAIQYNSANYVVRSSNGYTDLYEKKDGRWIAQVPNSCVIETTFPCRVYNPLEQTNVESLNAISKEVRSIKRKLSKKP